MKTIRKICLCFVLILLSQQTSAVVIDFGLGLNYWTVSYMEFISNGASTEKASFPATNVELGFHLGDNFLIKANYENQSSIVSEYVGTSMSTGATVTQKDNLSYTVEEIKFYYQLVPNWWIFAGYGDRIWWRGLGIWSETYETTYVPAGIYWTPGDRSSGGFGVEATVNTTLSGSMAVAPGTVNISNSTVTLGNLTGYKLTLEWKTLIGSGFTAKFYPWYEHLEYGQSNSVYNQGFGGYIYEPHSQTNLYGLGAMLIYSY